MSRKRLPSSPAQGITGLCRPNQLEVAFPRPLGRFIPGVGLRCSRGREAVQECAGERHGSERPANARIAFWSASCLDQDSSIMPAPAPPDRAAEVQCASAHPNPTTGHPDHPDLQPIRINPQLNPAPVPRLGRPGFLANHSPPPPDLIPAQPAAGP